MSLSLSVFSQSGPKRRGGGGGRGGEGRGGGRIPHFNWSIYRGGNFFFFFFFFEPGLKLDEKSIENGLEGQKFLVVCLFWGGCHHPNSLWSILVGWLKWTCFSLLVQVLASGWCGPSLRWHIEVEILKFEVGFKLDL